MCLKYMQGGRPPTKTWRWWYVCMRQHSTWRSHKRNPPRVTVSCGPPQTRNSKLHTAQIARTKRRDAANDEFACKQAMVCFKTQENRIHTQCWKLHGLYVSLIYHHVPLTTSCWRIRSQHRRTTMSRKFCTVTPLGNLRVQIRNRSFSSFVVWWEVPSRHVCEAFGCGANPGTPCIPSPFWTYKWKRQGLES